jgi:WD40 repeat protein
MSYSHAADGMLAPALQAALHQFAKPWYRLRAVHVFRDESNLSANPHLWSSIQAAIEDSEFLILMASPGAAASAWVPKEILAFLGKGSAENIILVLTEGELAWDEPAGDFDWKRTTAFPRLSRKVFDAEPLWVDLRWARTEIHLDQRNPRFREAVARISSALRAIPLDLLIGEDVQQHKRTTRMAWAGAIALASLSGILAVASVVAVDQRRRAERETAIAVRQRDIAVSRQLAGQSRDALDDKHDLALLLAAEALRVADTPQARGALFDALSDEPRLVRYYQRHTGAVTVVVFCGGGLLASAGRDGDASIRYWDVQSGKMLRAPLRAEKFRIDVMACSPDGKILASAGDGGVIRLWDTATGAALGTPIEAQQGLIASLAFRDNSTLAVGGGYGLLRLWDVHTGRPGSASVQAHSEFASLGSGSTESNAIHALAFSRDGKVLLSGAVDGSIARWDASALTSAGAPLHAHDGGVKALAFSPDGRVLASGGGKGEIALWSWPDMKPLAKRGSTASARVVFTPAGVLVSTDYEGVVKQWNGTTLQPAGSDIRAHQGRVWNIDAGAAALIATAGDDGTVILWNLDAADRLHAAFLAHAEAGVANAGDHTLIAASADSHIRWWSLKGAAPALLSEVTLPQIPSVTSLAPEFANRIAIGGEKGEVGLLDTARRKLIRDPLTAHQGSVGVLAFDAAGDRVASGDFIAGELRILDGVTGEARTPAAGAGLGYLWDLKFSADGSTLASSGNAGSIRLWRATDLKPLTGPIQRHPMGMNFLAYHPDGRLVSASGRAQDLNNLIYVLDGRTGEPLGPAIPTPPLSAICFTSDGRMLAGGGFDGALHLWAHDTFEYIGTLAGTSRNRGSLVLRHLACGEENRVAGAYDTGEVVVWNLDANAWRDRAREIANRDLTVDEKRRFLAAINGP